MAKVRMETLMAGPRGVFPAGSVIEVEAEVAAALVAGGFAVEVEEAVKPAPEKAVSRRKASGTRTPVKGRGQAPRNPRGKPSGKTEDRPGTGATNPRKKTGTGDAKEAE